MIRLLVANFFPAFHPPRSGGEQRYFYLYHHLSRWFDVTLLSPTYTNAEDEVVRFSESFREHRVPKDAVFDQLHWKLASEGIGPECSAYVVALAGATATAFGARFAMLAREADLIIHESPFTVPYDKGLGNDGTPRIYNAYNVEHRLAAQILRGQAGLRAVEFIRFLESALVDASQRVLVTCAEEGESFVADFGLDPRRTAMAANGFEPDADATRLPAGSVERYVVFMGSAHPPNVEGALFIAERLAPALPDVEFRILGAVCDHLRSPLPANVKALGFVDAPVKQQLLANSAAALNPLFSGAGTNLKMLDYMSSGVPIVTTAVGARGLDLRHGVDAYIVEGPGFADELRRVLADAAGAREVAGNARRRAFADFTWEHIAAGVRDTVAFAMCEGAVGEDGRARLRVLVVNDFPVSRATGGGQVRIHELLTELGREFDVSFLCFTDEADAFERPLMPGVTELAVPKTAQHRAAEAQASASSAISVNDLVAARLCRENAAFVAGFERLQKRSAVVVFEHPYLAPMLDFVPADKSVIYSSLNVESELKAAVLAPRADREHWLALVNALEHRLLARAGAVVCVSAADRVRFLATHAQQEVVVVENGARFGRGVTPGIGAIRRHLQAHDGRPLAIFIGSGHMPNVDAARFILEDVAPQVPEVVFGIVGSVCGALAATRRPGNAILFGVLEEDEKNALLGAASMAINPMFEGGGSSLKVPDSFAAGLALVSTAVGVRGYAVRDGRHYVAAERSDFAAAVRRLAAADALRGEIASNAVAYGRTSLDWRVLGARYRHVVRSLASSGRARPMLVVTYRYADPPPGGAEAFLLNATREIRRRGKLSLDIVACAAGTIADKWHFSATYEPVRERRAVPPTPGAARLFAVDAVPADAFADCARLFSAWMEETRGQSLDFLDLYRSPLLLGGWNFPEAHGARPVRWTSETAYVFVGAGGGSLALAGAAPSSIDLRFSCDGQCIATIPVDGPFSVSLPLAGSSSVIAISASRRHVAADDPRELGVLVRDMAVDAQAVDLGDDFEKVVRRADPQRWVRSLIVLTERRSQALDSLFVKVRGPHSTALLQWLEDNVASYDAVLIQGVPFATLVEATALAAKYGVATALLPHFHMEDRYYHWRDFYAAFRSADQVIAAPAQAKAVFFDAIGANSRVVPGGGIDPGEYDAARLPARQSAFRALHRGDKPFALVLGRKAGGKNYQVAIDAIRALNAQAHRLDLVLIGPDDDKAPITAANAYYYGAQPRDVVLGALSLAACLINMSDSESFGIVLLEAWLSGTPVVAQRKCVAFADLVRPGVNGYLAESVPEVAAAVDNYLVRPDIAREYALAGRAVALDHTWAKVGEAIEQVLMEVADTGALRARTPAIETAAE